MSYTIEPPKDVDELHARLLALQAKWNSDSDSHRNIYGDQNNVAMALRVCAQELADQVSGNTWKAFDGQFPISNSQ